MVTAPGNRSKPHSPSEAEGGGGIMDNECEYYSYEARQTTEGPIGDECFNCHHVDCEHNDNYDPEQEDLVL